MLILVGVTVNVVLNGGLFDTTKYATAETEKNAILEELISMIKWNNGSLDKEEIKNLAIAKYPNSTWNGTTGKLTIVGKQGTYEYKIADYEITFWDDKNQSEEYKFKIGDFVNKATVNETKDEDGNTEEYSYNMSIADFYNLINIEENELKKYIVHVKSTDFETEIIRADCENGGFDANDEVLDLLMNLAGISQEDRDKAGLRNPAEEPKFNFRIIINGQTIAMTLVEGTNIKAYYKINEIPENVLNTTLTLLKNSDALIKVLKDNNLTD